MKQHTHPLDENSLMNKEVNKQFIEEKKKEFFDEHISHASIFKAAAKKGYVYTYPKEMWQWIENTITQAISKNDLMWEERVKELKVNLIPPYGTTDKSIADYQYDFAKKIVDGFNRSIDNLLIHSKQ